MLLPHAGQYGLITALIFYSGISAQRRADRCIPGRDDYKNHRDIPALPFSQKRITAARPKAEGYPKELKTIGNHIRAWRIDNQLPQSDVAKILSVSEDTIVNWEIGEIVPAIKYMPEIIKMIGYLPVDIDTSFLGGRITHYRYMLGVTPKQFGSLIPADASTVRDWESGRHIPLRRKRLIVESIIKQIGASEESLSRNFSRIKISGL